MQSLCTRWIASARARAKTVFSHLKLGWFFFPITDVYVTGHFPSPGKSGVPMILYGCNDLGMRLQKLTASFGLLRSQLTNSQTSLCVRLETMEIQLEQLVLFESDEMLFSSVKICISTEREVIFNKLVVNTRSQAILQPRSQGTLSTSRKYPGYGWSRVC